MTTRLKKLYIYLPALILADALLMSLFTVLHAAGLAFILLLLNNLILWPLIVSIPMALYYGFKHNERVLKVLPILLILTLAGQYLNVSPLRDTLLTGPIWLAVIRLFAIILPIAYCILALLAYFKKWQ